MALVAAAAAAAAPAGLAWAEGGEAAALRGAAEPTLHESVLHLEEYPVAGGAPVGLVFNVTYSAAVSPGPAPVRLDVTGSEYGDLYRVHDIVSNVGAGDPSVFAPYDYEAENTTARDGETYTVRALLKVLAPGVIPVYARGLDGDIVTVHIAASESASMPYGEYLLSGQAYLDGAEGDGDPIGAVVAGVVQDPRDARHALHSRPQPQQSPSPVQKAASAPVPPGHSAAPGGAALGTAHPPYFDMHGTVVAEGPAVGDPPVPIHGIEVCAYDYNVVSGLDSLLSTMAGEDACAFTDSEGAYRISGIANRDPDDSSAADPFPVLLSIGENDLEVTTADFYYYYDEPNYYARDVGSDIEHDFELFGAAAGAARIVDAMSDARAFFEPYGLARGPLWVLWQHNAGASELPGSRTNGAKYAFVPDVGHIIWLDGYTPATNDDSRFRYTLLHEFGHYAASLAGVLNDYSCPIHYVAGRSTLGCAWGEGWAGFVPHVIDGRPAMPDSDTIMYDIEAAAVKSVTGAEIRYYDSREPPSRNIGEMVEGLVAAALWDMADAALDPVHDVGGPGRPLALDSLAVGYDSVVGAVLSATYDSASDFYSAWERDHYGDSSAEAIMRLHNMSFAIPNSAKYYGLAGSFGANGTGDGQMRHPLGIDVAPDGTVLVADTANRRVQAFDADGGYLRQFGQGGSVDNRLVLPVDVAANATHVLVADAFAGRIAAFDMAGGMRVDDPARLGSPGRLAMPVGIAANSTHLVVADAADYTITAFWHNGTISSKFYPPDELDIDLANFLAYRMIDPGLEKYGLGGLGLVLSNRVAIAPDGTAAFVTFTDDLIQLVGPSDPGYLFWNPYIEPNLYKLSDIDFDLLDRTVSSRWTDGRIQVIHTDGTFVEQFGGYGRGDARFRDLAGLAAGPTGRLYAADAGNNRIQMFDLDLEAPAVDGVAARAPDGTTFFHSDMIYIAVSFTEPVTVNASGGLPVLELEVGGSTGTGTATYVSGSGSRTLTFVYEVGLGDATQRLGYGSEGALDLNGAAIADGSGNMASVALPAPGGVGSLSHSSDVRIVPPPPVIILDVWTPQAAAPPAAPATGAYGAGDRVEIVVEFSEPVAVSGSPRLLLDAGPDAPPATAAAYKSGSGTERLAFEYAVDVGHNTLRLGYAGPGALSVVDGAVVSAATGLGANLSLPEPGSPGSLSHTSRVVVLTTRSVVDIGVIDDAGGIAAAALLAAADYNGAAGRSVMLNVTVHAAVGSNSDGGAGAAAALRAAHAAGAGPSLYVGPSTDRGLHAAMPYAAEYGLVLVSAGSTAPSLAVEGDRTFRLLPSDALQADALARLAYNAGAESVHAVVEAASYGPASSSVAQQPPLPPPQGRFAHGFAEALADSAIPYLAGTVALEGAAGGPYRAAAAAATLDGAVESAAAPAAIIYLGSPAGLAALAEAAASAGHPALRSALWFASDMSAGSGLLTGEGSAPAAEFAAHVGLAAVRWSPPDGDLARRIDSLSPGADPGGLHRARAAYDAVSILGTAASGAGGADAGAAAVAERLEDAAAAYAGALGDIALDPAGDLWLPARHDVLAVVQADPGGAGGGASPTVWTPRAGVLDEARACSIILERAKIDYGPIDPGQTSRPYLQTITNTGQLTFSHVDLIVTPWHVDSPGRCAPGSIPSLPVGLSEIRTELGGAFSDLVARGTVVARGLEAGGQAQLWYRLNLADYSDLPQAEISQCATYVVRCS